MSETKWRTSQDSVTQVHGEIYVTDDPAARFPEQPTSYWWFRVDYDDGERLAALLNGQAATIARLRGALEWAMQYVLCHRPPLD